MYNDYKGGKIYFSGIDYTLFVCSLLISVIIGAYYGFFEKKQSSMTDYLLAGRTMKIAPIAMSLIATIITPTTFIAIPSDIYRYGAAIAVTLPIKFLVILYIAHVHLPVFFNSEVSTTYEYLEKRFDSRVRKLGSFLFSLGVLINLPFDLLLPSLTLTTATGIRTELFVVVICGSCAFYTAYGGIRAVIWTDVFQLLIFSCSIIIVCLYGIGYVGGLPDLWDRALQGDRLDIFNFDPDPTKRNTFWTLSIGTTTIWLSDLCVNQAMIIKFLSVPTYSQAKKAAYCMYVGFILVQIFVILLSLILYAKYWNCDPYTSKLINKHDQIVPYFVMDVARNIKGLSGIFVAGVVWSGLSTLSPDLNSLAGSIYEDFLGNYLTKKSIITPGAFMKLSIILLSLVLILLAILFQKFNELLPLMWSLRCILNGPLMGLFILGMLFPKCHNIGAFYGGIVGLIIMSWLVIMNKYYEAFSIKHPTKPLSIDGCDFNVTINEHLNVVESTFEPFVLFRISFYYTAGIGMLVTTVSGLIITYICNLDNRPIDKTLLSPVIYFLLPREETVFEQVNYVSVKKAKSINLNNDELEL